MSQQNRNLGPVISGGCGMLVAIRNVWSMTLHWWLIGVGGLQLALGLLALSWLEPARKAWMKLAQVLGLTNSRILLTMVFALLITPIALLLRVLSRQPSQSSVPGGESYWHGCRAEEIEAKRMERQF